VRHGSSQRALLIGFYEARELVGFDRFLHVQAWLDLGPAVQRGLQVTTVEERFACG
jgi:GST-like protein